MANKQGSNKEANVRTYYTEVNKFNQNGEYDKAIKSLNKILNVQPEDTTASHCKVVCLIQLAKFGEAIQFIERYKLSELVFEKAYCEYRLNNPAKALDIIDSAKLPSPLPPKIKELRAQVLYRLEKFEECFDVYRDIIKNTDDDYEDERTTNLSAVVANLAIAGTPKDVPNIRDDTYELCYNNACADLGRRQFNEAERKLRQSEKICCESLDEDDDIEEEVAIIKVQLAYCLHMQGRIKEATAIYSDALKHKSSDVALTAVASNNMVAINKDQNVFDSKKKIRAAMAEACEHKLTARQKKTIALNNCLLTLYTNQDDQCHQLVAKLIQTYPNVQFEGLLIRATQMAKNKKFKDAIELLEKYAKVNPDDDLATKFAIIQLLLMSGNRKVAIDQLQSLPINIKYQPGVVSAVVSLQLGLDNKTAASDVLKECVDFYKKNKTGSAADLTDMWRQAANFHLRGGNSDVAAGSLEELLKNNPNDEKSLAQLVIAYAKYDARKAQEASKRLPALDSLTNSNEIDALEATNWMMSTKAAKKTGAQSSRGEQSPSTPGSEPQTMKKRAHRKRKPKLPKNYNPEVPPDSERWLPKYERSNYRRTKRDRRNKDVIKGSQGMSTGAADQYDMSKSQNLTKNSPITPQPEQVAPGPRQHQRKNHPKKKKNNRF